MEWLIQSENELENVVDWVIDEMTNTRIFLLKGDLGSGKTTLMKYIGKRLNVSSTVQSPTFSLIHEYKFPNEQDPNAKIYHMDLYRLKSADEAIQIGIEEYLDDPYVCFIEWPELILPLIQDPYRLISLQITPEHHRKIRIFNQIDELSVIDE